MLAALLSPILAVSPLVAPQSEVRVVLRELDPIPGGGRVNDIVDWQLNDRGDVLTLVESVSGRRSIVLNDALVLRQFTEIVPGVLVDRISEIDLDEDGTVAFIGRSNLGRILVHDGAVVLQEGQTLTGVDLPGVPAMTVLSSPLTIASLEYPWLTLMAETRAPGEAFDHRRWLRFRLDQGTAAQLVDGVATEGEAFTPDGDVFGTLLQSGVTSDGVVGGWVGSSLSSIAWDGEVLLRHDDPAIEPDHVWRMNQVAEQVVFDETGSYAVSALSRHRQSLTPSQRYILRDGVPYVSEGDAIPSIPGATVDFINSFAVHGMSHGGELLYELKVLEEGQTRDVLFVDGQPILEDREVLSTGERVLQFFWRPGQNRMTSGGSLAGVSAQLFDTVGNGGTYQALLLFERTPGTSTDCEVTPNSTGVPGEIVGTGSRYLSEDGITLTATGLPANAFGYLLTAPTQAFVPMVGSSAGNLCLGAPLGRFVQQSASSGPAGTIETLVSLSALPQPSGPVSAVAGETWTFQLWHRDAVQGVTTSNLTRAYEVVVR